MDQDEYIVRRNVERLLVHKCPVEVVYEGITLTGVIDGMGQHGFWIRPEGLTYIPYAEAYNVKEAEE